MNEGLDWCWENSHCSVIDDTGKGGGYFNWRVVHWRQKWNYRRCTQIYWESCHTLPHSTIMRQSFCKSKDKIESFFGKSGFLISQKQNETKRRSRERRIFQRRRFCFGKIMILFRTLLWKFTQKKKNNKLLKFH